MCYFLLFFSFFSTILWAQSLQIEFKNSNQEILGYLAVGINQSSHTQIPLTNQKKVNIPAEVGRITAIFSHSQTNLQQTLKNLRSDHFNWINLVVGGENARFPMGETKQKPHLWIDPLPLGNQGEQIATLVDDLRPFFWSEETYKEKGVFTEILGKNIGNQSIFTDHPRNSKNSIVFFETYLVAVEDPLEIIQSKTFYVLGGVSWKSHTNSQGERDSISHLNPIQITLENHLEITQRIQLALNGTDSFRAWKASSLYSKEDSLEKNPTREPHPKKMVDLALNQTTIPQEIQKKHPESSTQPKECIKISQ